MRCSAAFLFSGGPLVSAGSPPGPCHHSLQFSLSTNHRGDDHERGVKYGETTPSRDRANNYGNSWRGRAPCPVTARQLCRAVLGMNDASICTTGESEFFGENTAGRREADALRMPVSNASGVSGGGSHACDGRYDFRAAVSAARLGESTIRVDAFPRHRVVVCGRIVRCIDAVANGSVAAAEEAAASAALVPYDLLWISDTTGVVCVLRIRPALAHRHVSLPLSRCCWGASQSLTASNERNCTFATSQREPVDGVASVRVHSPAPSAKPSVLCESAVGWNWCSSTTEGRQSSTAVQKGDSTPNPIRFCTEATAAILKLGFEPRDTDDLGINDYVVCVGSVAFADVDPQMGHALEPHASDLRRATWAAATPSWSSCSVAPGVAPPLMGTGPGSCFVGSRVCGGDDSDAACGGKVPVASNQHRFVAQPSPKEQFVLLPGSEVPLTLEAARAELGLIGSLPANTRYLSAAEAAQWGSTSFDYVATSSTPSSSSASAHRGRKSEVSVDCDIATTETAAVADMDWVPLMGIRGQPRLVVDTNECLFWWLAAAETHLRLRARVSEPLTCL
ncbi:hypothetical protein JKF63_02289 [Porcisia hertigi]|uniref:Uncharacterized protein n=1 Tax=Porcisia hertigi TaxID=2761500 RepID=A0A836HPA6_9TRYP|nr:hypothetical protein JKF63_02289 [Porcisia hertigi]